MAQPEIVKDIDARVKIPGDQMTGNLSIRKKSYPQFFLISNDANRYTVDELSDQGIYIISNRNYNETNGLNGVYFNIKTEQETSNNLLTLGRNKNGIYDEFTILHTGNINLADNRYVLKSGDTMTGNLTAPQFNGYLNGIAQKSYMPYGFTRYNTTGGWGVQTGTCLIDWGESDGGDVDIRKNCPQSGQVSIKVDGRFYQNEGQYMCLDTNNFSSYALPKNGGTINGSSIYQWEGATYRNPNQHTPELLINCNNSTSNISGYRPALVLYNPNGNINQTVGLTFAFRETTSSGNAVMASAIVGVKESSGNSDAWSQGGLQILTKNYKSLIQAMHINCLGNVGIGVSPPSHKLHVNGNICSEGTIYYKGLRMQSFEITVGGDLNTYYPVAVDSAFSGNTEAIIITVSKTLGTTSPAWSGNHNGGTSSLMASYLVRNNGWDGNGNFVYSITPPQQWYAQVLSHVELRQSAAHHLVFWLRGGGATYRIAANIPTTINVYLSETNLGNSSYPNNVSPRTDIGNAGWLFESPVYLPIKGGTVDGTIRANNVYGAVWNDYAEFRSSDPVEPGRVICETGNGTLKLSTERLQPGANVVSDTFGFAIGETENCKTPIAVSGRVLVYTYEDRYSYAAGDPVCAGPDGTISKMSREEVMMYPDRIVGTVSEIPEYERWGTGNVEVKNRIWIKVK